jgi:hypothetical protein
MAHLNPTVRDHGMMILGDVLPRLDDQQVQALVMIAVAFEDGDHFSFVNYSERARNRAEQIAMRSLVRALEPVRGLG